MLNCLYDFSAQLYIPRWSLCGTIEPCEQDAFEPVVHWFHKHFFLGFQLKFFIMPTFKKFQGSNGLFSEQSLRNAVKDVTKNKLSVREAAKVYKNNRTTLG